MLSVRFQLADLDTCAPVEVEERRGDVRYLLSKGLFVPEGVAALNSATALLLAGGHWYQTWRGETIQIEGDYARVHRGPLVDQAPRPQDW